MAVLARPRPSSSPAPSDPSAASPRAADPGAANPRQRPHQRRLAAVATAALLAASLAACGNDTPLGGSGTGGGPKKTEALPPQEALKASLEGLGNSSAIDLTFRLGVSAEDLKAISTKGEGDPLTDAQAKLIAGGDIQLVSRTTDGSKVTEAKPGATAFSLAVHTDGGSIVEMRSTDGKTLFVRADVKKIAEISGTPASEVARGLADVPPQLSFLKDGAAGKWLSLDLVAAQGLAKQFGGSAVPSPDPAAAKAAGNELLAALQRDVVATRGEASDKGDHLILTGSTRTLATDFVTTLSKAVPGGAAGLGSFKPEDVEDKPFTLDAYVKDGRLSLLSLDVSQFAEGKDKADLNGKPFPVEIAFGTESPSIEAPADAVRVDLQKVVQAFLGGLSSGS